MWRSIEYACSFPESLRTGENTGDEEILTLDKIKALKLNLRAIDRLDLGRRVKIAETLCLLEIWVTDHRTIGCVKLEDLRKSGGLRSFCPAAAKTEG